jgi:signal transduction histidine kinase
LTNIRKHAHPSYVSIALHPDEGGVSLCVEDVSPEEVGQPVGARAGYGLIGMRERAELLGGSLEATSTLHGFRLRLWLPKR